MEKKKTGPLSTKDREATQALGEFYHWLASSLKHVKTYEEGVNLIEEADAKMIELEEKHPAISTAFYEG